MQKYIRSKIVELTLSARRKKEMAPMQVLALIAWLMIMTLAGNEAHQQPMKLMTRPSDAAALCALDPPTLSATMSQTMPEAPAAVRCAMTCTSDGRCKHFNYVSTESNPCQLYHYRPTNFDVLPNCQHYYEPGLRLIKYISLYRIDDFVLNPNKLLTISGPIYHSFCLQRRKAMNTRNCASKSQICTIRTTD